MWLLGIAILIEIKVVARFAFVVGSFYLVGTTIARSGVLVASGECYYGLRTRRLDEGEVMRKMTLLE